MRKYICYFLFFFYSSSSSAQFNISEGIFASSSSRSLLQLGDTMYATSDGCDIFMSFDSGLTWNSKIEIDAGIIQAVTVKDHVVFVACRAFPKHTGMFTVIYKIKNGIIIDRINQHTPNFKNIQDIFILGDSVLLATDKGLFLNNTIDQIKLPIFEIYTNSGLFKKPNIQFIKACRDSFIFSMTSCLVIADSTFSHFKLLTNSKSIKFDPIYSDGTYCLNDAICLGDSVIFVNEMGVFLYDFSLNKSCLLFDISGYAHSKIFVSKLDILFSNTRKIYSLKNNLEIETELSTRDILIYDVLLLSNRILIATDKGIYYKKI